MHNQENFFTTMGMVVKDDKIWFTARETNGLFCMDISGDNIEYMGSFPNELEDGSYLYGECVLHEDVIIFAPYVAEELAVYDTKKKEFQKYPLDKNLCGNHYLPIIKWNDEVILLPTQKNNSVIVRININNREIQYINDWQDKFIINDNISELFFDYCIKGNILYAPVIAAQGQIMKYNLENHEICCMQVDVVEAYKTICCDEKNFYLYSHRGNKLLILDEYFKVVDSQVICEYNDIKINNTYYQNGNVFLFTVNSFDAQSDDMIITYNINTKKTERLVCIDSREGQANYARAGRRFTIFCNSDGKIYSFYSGNGMLYVIDSENTQVKSNKVQCIKTLSVYQEKYIRNNGNVTYQEKKDGSILLDYLIQQGINADIKQGKKYGKEIWKEVLS